MSEKLQTLAAQLKEAVEKAISRMEKDARNIYEASELLRQCGHELAGTVYNCHFETLGAIEAAKSALRNLVPPLLEEIGKPSSASAPSGEIDYTWEYDDGKPVDYKAKNDDKHPRCTRRGRKRGIYLKDGISWNLIPLGLVRISEMDQFIDWLRSFVERNGVRRG